MPLGGLVTGGLVTGGISGLAGLFNKRGPSLSPSQSGALNSLLSPSGNLMQTATGTPQIDPIQQALMYGQNANSLTGANNAVTHSLVSRGLGQSGLLGAGLMQNQNQSQVNQNSINLGLQQQAVQQRQLSIQDIAQLLNVGNTPGQSGAGAFMAGLAPVAAYSIQNALNNNYANQNNQLPTYNPAGTNNVAQLLSGIGGTPPIGSPYTPPLAQSYTVGSSNPGPMG